MGLDGLGAPRTHFNPPSPCGEGPLPMPGAAGRTGISIHPPRVGRDNPVDVINIVTSAFQSTLPMRGGTVLLPAGLQESPISIHPPRVGRDSKSTQKSFSISCTFDKFSRIFRHHILFSGRESKNRRRICQNLSAKVSGKSWALPPSHRSRPSESRRDRSRVSPHSG